MKFKDAYEARVAIGEALAWFTDEDGWTRDELETLAAEEIERQFPDEEE